MRIQVSVDEQRNVKLSQTVAGEIKKTRLPYLHRKWIRSGRCPYCKRPIEVVIEEIHNSRNIYLRIARQVTNR